MKLWHDDVRMPPDDSWTWAKTNADAQAMLKTGRVKEASLDHDLGAETGLDLARWMCAGGFLPARITVHSWNPVGARHMAAVFQDHDHGCVLEPFQVAA